MLSSVASTPNTIRFAAQASAAVVSGPLHTYHLVIARTPFPGGGTFVYRANKFLEGGVVVLAVKITISWLYSTNVQKFSPAARQIKQITHKVLQNCAIYHLFSINI